MRGFLTACGVVLFSALGWAQNEHPSAESVRLIESIRGPALFKAHCAACHGSDAKGAGPMAQSLKVKVPDLTRIAVRNGGKFPLARVERIISGEDQLPAAHGTREMPLWGPIFSEIAWDQDLGRVRVDNLARYLAELQTK